MWFTSPGWWWASFSTVHTDPVVELARLPRLSTAWWRIVVVGVPSVLGVFAHPDDESLSAGGFLARTASEGGRTAVVTATWAAGSSRASELAEALRLLGAEPPRLLGYADARAPHSASGRGRFCDAPLDESVGRVVEHIRDFRPDIIVTHDALGGVTGHPDHVQTHRVTVLAVRAAASDGLYPDSGPPWSTRSLYLATHPDSAMEALIRIVGPRKVRFGVPDDQVSLRLDVTSWLDVKVAAVLSHESEVLRGALPGLVAGMTPGARAELLATEWYACSDLASDGPSEV
jgi:N-acetyl-1-D-myo-inositol-2-amino-2-deoxy-alpha-D-glucopyranoside deacetylase